MGEGVLLVGASGLAREVLAAGMTGVAGILDDDVSLHGTEIAGVPVVGPVADAAAGNEQLLVCIGPSGTRREVVRRLGRSGVAAERYATYVARSARMGTTSDVGSGSILLDGVVVTADARLGRHVVVMPNCVITHDAVLEDFATLTSGVALAGGVRVGEAAYIGMNAAVRQGLSIGAAATVGMGAAVLSDVPAGEIWAGVPARRLGVTK
ncbi:MULTISPECIES: NeuD/PglB/VioB family sugar acetyltransferase [Microbacterium]|uniref:Acetyltransferase n=1 Tax=Microbacterium wangchenii TaxID=2541726 RepID=A0ABX5SSE8_9MICO|nr:MULTISPECIES: NeuD/PglB/VioB family sugar acetyltransferase [Microbacterium]KAA9148189.1 acetyltransferase [Microbacterium lushaniae]KAA9150370.1 acetyltransferase [Microbacterium lushaniae]MCK6068075.1 NeuD/PglB/VioB family sugar acetyltransferase [Microbacterium sp. EYE_512]QBR87799.1 acetyltransferase [Microbacterium wangchenii]TXK16092.1 acetyltransferase [Microbacterium wangchenii]